MTEHLGGPELPEVIRKRSDNDVAMTPGDGKMFVINDWSLGLRTWARR